MRLLLSGYRENRITEKKKTRPSNIILDPVPPKIYLLRYQCIFGAALSALLVYCAVGISSHWAAFLLQHCCGSTVVLYRIPNLPPRTPSTTCSNGTEKRL